jgi:4a-hydroxytetrahydrobiopterin dehydratase
MSLPTAETPIASNVCRGARKSCVPCSSMDPTQLLDFDHIKDRLQNGHWKIGSNENVQSFLYRKFTCKNFQASLNCINDMGRVAEAEAHHPNFHLTNYREVLVEIFTHKLNGITENDLILAEKLDEQVKIDYSPRWLKDHPGAESTAVKIPEKFDI